jgi:type II pantothenate kinase
LKQLIVNLSPFCKLADPASYQACDWDLSQDIDGRTHWCDFFKRHFDTIMKLGIEAAIARGASHDAVAARARRAQGELVALFDDFLHHPQKFGRVTMLEIDTWRDDILRKWDFPDAFIDLKNRENATMLPLLPKVCAQLDGLAGEEQFRAMIEGVFAGNIFDMGADATAKAFLAGSPDFFTTRKTLPPRPWLIDDYDQLAQRCLSHGHRKAVFFIDNAGSDFLLGALPMIRWLAKRGTRVIIAANEQPALNDMTIHDVHAWWPRIIQIEPSFANLAIDLVSTGTGEPLIDLSKVSGELNAAAADADLVIIEGMGRGIESNLGARFTCDALNIAMIKDTIIAKRAGGKVFDLVCKFRTGC